MSLEERVAFDPDLIRELFDLQGEAYAARGGSYEGDLDGEFKRLREQQPGHHGTPHELIGFSGEVLFAGLPMPERPHVTVFDYETCDMVLRTPERFSASQHEPGSHAYEHEQVLLFMDGRRHHRMRSLVQRSFISGRMGWWIDNWVAQTVDALLDLIEPNGRADLNIEYFAAIPLLTICRSFGVSFDDAWTIRRAVISDGVGLDAMNEILLPIIKDRRALPQDDLISVLVQAEVEDEDGKLDHLSDVDILWFSFILLAAGSGTTWKQLGITTLTLLQHPDWLERVRDEPNLLVDVIEETARWLPTDPVFARYAVEDTELHGIPVPKGAVVHVCLGAANRDPARWPDRPDEYDPARERQPHLAFGRGPHVCLGQHVARAEMRTAIGALIARLPGLRLDPDAVPPRVTGIYERGPTSVPVTWDTP